MTWTIAVFAIIALAYLTVLLIYRRRIRRRSAELAAKRTLPLRWELVDRRLLCDQIQMEKPCPQRWEALQLTDNPGIRHCSQCQKNVHLCRSQLEAYGHADAGQCIAYEAWNTNVMALGYPSGSDEYRCHRCRFGLKPLIKACDNCGLDVTPEQAILLSQRLES